MPLLGRSRIAAGSRSATARLSRYFSTEPRSLSSGGMANAGSTTARSNSGERGSTPKGKLTSSILCRMWCAPLKVRFMACRRVTKRGKRGSASCRRQDAARAAPWPGPRARRATATAAGRRSTCRARAGSCARAPRRVADGVGAVAQQLGQHHGQVLRAAEGRIAAFAVEDHPDVGRGRAEHQRVRAPSADRRWDRSAGRWSRRGAARMAAWGSSTTRWRVRQWLGHQARPAQLVAVRRAERDRVGAQAARRAGGARARRPGSSRRRPRASPPLGVVAREAAGHRALEGARAGARSAPPRRRRRGARAAARSGGRPGRCPAA